MDGENYRRLPHRENDHCFACSQDHPSGLRMEFFTDEKLVYSRQKVPAHLSGWGNIVHGGILSTMLDEAMGWTALHLLKKMTLTKSITVDFLKPVYVGEELRIESMVSRVANEREAEMQSLLFNEQGELCVKGAGIFALFTFDAMKERGVVPETVLEDVKRLVEG